jgi:hypothetical protein
MMDVETALSSVIPTASNVINHLYQMMKDSKVGDVSVCYFSGHGGRFTFDDAFDKHYDIGVSKLSICQLSIQFIHK